MTAILLAAPTDVMAWDRDAVAVFDLGRDDILVVERPPLPGIAGAVASARVHDFRSVVTPASAHALAAESLAALHIDCPMLAEDIAALARDFLAQFGAAEGSLRVEVVDKTTCPKFHCDNVRVRLVTTYHGPATEYVFDDAPEEVRAAPGFALVFLKGHKHPTHADAVHHRSPPVPPGGKRLCVILDF
jgi:hypothetical protein